MGFQVQAPCCSRKRCRGTPCPSTPPSPGPPRFPDPSSPPRVLPRTLFLSQLPNTLSILTTISSPLPPHAFTHSLQTRSLASDVSVAQIQTGTRVLGGTLPERRAATDFSYGDAREALSAASLSLEGLSSYCWNCDALNCQARMDNLACTRPRAFTPTESALTLLDSYGLKGDLTVSLINPATGKVRKQSVVVPAPGGDGGVQYCGILPRPAGYSALDPYGSSFASWRAAIKRAETPCGLGEEKRRRGGLIGGREHDQAGGGDGGGGSRRRLPRGSVAQSSLPPPSSVAVAAAAGNSAGAQRVPLRGTEMVSAQRTERVARALSMRWDGTSWKSICDSLYGPTGRPTLRQEGNRVRGTRGK